MLYKQECGDCHCVSEKIVLDGILNSILLFLKFVALLSYILCMSALCN